MIQGAFRIATKSTDYMTRVLGKAAENRAAGLSDTRMRPYTVDEQNVENYWGRHIEPGKNNDNNIFSIHPPFNFVAVYGINDTVFAMPPRPDSQSQYVIDKYNTGYGTLSNDDNHTILEADQENNIMRRIIESVEIIDMQVEYNTSGQVCSEVYTFMARDAYSPMPPREVPNQTQTPSASATEAERIVGGGGGSGSVQF